MGAHKMNSLLLPVLCLLAVPILSVSGHANMVWPPVWQDIGGQLGRTPYSNMFIGGEYFFDNDIEKSGVVTMWYTNYTFIEGEPTLEPYLRTFANIEPGLESYVERNPWMAPGSAPVFSGCGVAGGNPLGCPEGTPERPGQDCGGEYKGGYSYGPRAEDFEFRDVLITEWKRGQVVTAGWQ